MSRILTIDVETTISNKGNPFDQTNKVVRAGFKKYKDLPILTDGEYLPSIQKLLDSSEWFVGFNIKFDLHWLRNLGYTIPKHIKIFDCQLAHFLLSKQMCRFPSLDEALAKQNIPLKVDKVKKYWDEGIDTDQIPQDILDEYLIGDLDKTEELAIKLKPILQFEGLYNLFRLQCEDLLVLEEMEYNGIKFDVDSSLLESVRVEREMNDTLTKIYDHLGFSNFNIASNDHLSAVLYGGFIKEPTKIPIGYYKTGARKGEIKFKNDFLNIEFKRRFEPIEGTETKKEGYWYVNDDVLSKIKPIDKKDIVLIDMIKHFNKLNKLVSTYLRGWPEFIKEKNWPKDSLHGNLNQCSVVTGRLSSTQPNQQNADPITKKFIYSRYKGEARVFVSLES